MRYNDTSLGNLSSVNHFFLDVVNFWQKTSLKVLLN